MTNVDRIADDAVLYAACTNLDGLRAYRYMGPLVSSLPEPERHPHKPCTAIYAFIDRSVTNARE